MKTFFQLALPFALLSLAGCSDDLGEQGCTLEARSSVNVKVVDAAGAAVTDATVTFSDDGAAPENCELLNTDYVCGFERDGQLTITVTKGADTKTQTVTVGKTEDGCHVVSESITITLGT